MTCAVSSARWLETSRATSGLAGVGRAAAVDQAAGPGDAAGDAGVPHPTCASVQNPGRGLRVLRGRT